jgi:hypothetical protein
MTEFQFIYLTAILEAGGRCTTVQLDAFSDLNRGDRHKGLNRGDRRRAWYHLKELLDLELMVREGRARQGAYHITERGRIAWALQCGVNECRRRRRALEMRRAA